MGWGELTTPRQGDMGAGVLSPSQRITAKAEFDRSAKTLAEAVEAFYQDHSTGAQESMFIALAAFRRAEAGLRP